MEAEAPVDTREWMRDRPRHTYHLIDTDVTRVQYTHTHTHTYTHRTPTHTGVFWIKRWRKKPSPQGAYRAYITGRFPFDRYRSSTRYLLARIIYEYARDPLSVARARKRRFRRRYSAQLLCVCARHLYESIYGKF